MFPSRHIWKLFVMTLMAHGLMLTTHHAVAQRLRVALEENPPSTFTNSAGEPAGLFVELLTYIAEQEGWQLEYVPLSFNESLQMLHTGEVDIKPNLAKSPERLRDFVYNEAPVVPSYGQVFTSLEIETLQDLADKRIGYLENDIFVTSPTDGFLFHIEEYRIEAELVPFTSYEAITRALNNEEIDAGVLNQLYGGYMYHAENWYDWEDIHATTLVFAPSTLHFAFPSDDEKYKSYAARIDHHIAQLKSDKSSLYYSLMSKHVYLKDDFSLPEWIVLLLAVLTGSVIVFVTFTAILNRMVNVRTVELQSSEKEISAKQQKLQMALASAREGVIEYDLEADEITLDENSPNLLGYNFPGLTFSYDTMLQVVLESDLERFKQSFVDYFEDGREYHELEFRAKQQNGNIRWLRIQGKTVERKDDAPTKYLGTVLDIHEKKLNEQERERLVDELTGRNKELQCLYSISRMLTDPLTSIRSALGSAAELLESALSHNGKIPVRITYQGWSVHTEGFEEVPTNLVRPISVQDQEEGKIEVAADASSFEEVLTDEEQKLVESIAQLLSALIDRKLLLDQLDNSEIKEREKIARELHDSVQQTLTVASLNLKYVDDRMTSSEPGEEVQSKIDAGIKSVTRAIEQIRSLSHELEINFVDGVNKMLKDLKEVSDTEFGFHTNLGEERLEHRLEIALFRITQEAINNIMKHASASKSTIQLMKYPDLAILTIEDDGDGFDIESTPSGYGLNSIRTRASQINANVGVSSQPGKGTAITIEVPLT